MNKSIETIIKENLLGKVLHDVQFGINEPKYEFTRKATLPQKIKSISFGRDEDDTIIILSLENGENVPVFTNEDLRCS